jgi:ketosteroid isomerase-like protein
VLGVLEAEMSNIATVQSIYEAFGRGDVAAILDNVAEDAAWEAWENGNTTQDAGVPWMLARRGRDGVAEFFQEVAGRLEFHSFEPRNLLEGGDQVAATIEFDVTARATGERFQDEEIHLWTFDADGKVSGMRHYVDTAKHIKAAKGSLADVG